MTEISELYRFFLSCDGVNTDSRTVKKGEMFFALKGENFDGNAYAVAALDAGAAYAVVAEDSAAARLSAEDVRIIPVKDTLVALKDLARTHRQTVKHNGKPLTVIGLTGTNGKTTTKELLGAVLSRKYNVAVTPGNLNNEIGVPLSILKIRPETDIAVIEMGASHPYDIRSLVTVSMPDYGLITNVGKGHLLGFGSYEGVARTKGELYDYITEHGGSIFLNEDLPYLRKMAEERGIENIIPYGVEYDGIKVLPLTGENPCLRLEVPADCRCSEVLETHLAGLYNAANIAAALAIGKHFGIEIKDAVEAIGNYVPSNNRSQILRTKSNLLIIDAYNANPVSMAAALDNLRAVNSDRKAVMLGDMLELGDESAPEHDRIVAMVSEMRPDCAFFVGSEFGAALERAGMPEGCFWYENSGQLSAFLESREKLSGYSILIKGSRGTRMEKVIPSL